MSSDESWEMHHGPYSLESFIKQLEPEYTSKKIAEEIIENWLPRFHDNSVVDYNGVSYNAGYETGYDEGIQDADGDEYHREGYDEGYADAERAFLDAKQYGRLE